MTNPDDTNERNLVNLTEADLDTPVYRIYPLERFESLLASQQDALPNPSRWPDKFENFFLSRTEVMDDVSGSAIPLTNLAEDWYGQCWSRREESDAMWRIYSPDAVAKPGVKVGTTIRKLFDNLKRAATPGIALYLQCFVGRLDYRTEAEISDFMRGMTFSKGVLGGQGEHLAAMLCIKRDAFKHEDEVRLMFHDVARNRGVGGVFHLRVDPHFMFDEVVLDPRLDDAAKTDIETRMKAAGSRLPVRRSDLYRTPRFTIPFA